VRRARTIVAVALVVASAAFAIARRSAPAESALPRLPDGVRYETSSRRADDWRREGYVEMVSPIRPPTSDDGRVKIAVFVRWPTQALIRAVQRDGEWTLVVPDGTEADRVELLADDPGDAEATDSWRVLDVRGITFEAAGQRLRVLRPRDVGGRDLLGITWSRERQGAATALLGALVLGRNVAAPAEASARERAAAHVRSLNDCPSCHTPYAGGRHRRGDPGVVNRAADGSGLIQLSSVLRDRLPFETYRPRDANAGDPYIARFCGSVRVDSSVLRCLDGSVLEGELDIRTALVHRDPHALRVCESRRQLGAHLDDAGRNAFRASLAECGDGTASSFPKPDG
jgi:hypothetical protein